jgi:Methyltransferase domain
MMMIFKREMFHHLAYLYGFTRYLAERFAGTPLGIVETGVQEGASSAFILQALADERAAGNPGGHLWSVDLPNVVYPVESMGKVADDTLPPWAETGIMVREELRGDWTLAIGDARERLPGVLEEAGPVHLFHHDSLHTRDHMDFEFSAAWPHVVEGGIMAADDALWTRSLAYFARGHRLFPWYAQNPRTPGAGGFVVREATA